MSRRLSWRRCGAMLFKEFTQMARDRLTFAMMVAIPLVELVLFGYAINNNPHHLPTALVSADQTAITRQLEKSLENTDYFKFVSYPKSIQVAEQELARGKVLFVIRIPPNFTRDLIHGSKPQILIEGDATDPVGVANSLSAVNALQYMVFKPIFYGPLAQYQQNDPFFQLITHARYNPEDITAYNIVPGLMGVVLTMTLVMITSLAITRERETGTMESLLATPVRPIEVMVGKITPYLIVAYIQILLILIMGGVLFGVPMLGNVITLLLAALPFVAANLSMGLMFSSMARNQLQAVQMAIFFFLPSILLSGFMFPFMGMPQWARFLGEILPLTHFLRIVRGILLKGNGWVEIWPNVWPIVLFAIIAIIIGVKRYRQTLD
jgi:ABC-2 type transport system permease protein